MGPFFPHLNPGTTLRWTAPNDGQLSVSHGRLWVTFSAADAAADAPPAADHFVTPGHSLRVAAGQNVVLESCPLPGQAQTQWGWNAEAPCAARLTLRQRLYALLAMNPGSLSSISCAKAM